MLANDITFVDLQAVGKRLYDQCTDNDLNTSVTFPMGMAQHRPSQEQKDCFNSTLLRISDSIPPPTLEIMVTVTPIPDSRKENVVQGHKLFNEMKQCGCISENDSEFLEDLMRELELVKSLEILEGYKQRFPPRAYPVFMTQRALSTPHQVTTPSPYSSLPAQLNQQTPQQQGVRFGSMPEAGVSSQQPSAIVGSGGYTQPIPHSGYFGSNPHSMSSGTLSSGNLGSMSSGTLSSGNFGSASSGGDSLRPNLTPLSSNRFPQQAESHDTNSSDEFRTAPAMATPHIQSENHIPFQKSVSLPPFSLSPPSSGHVNGQHYWSIPHDETYSGPRVSIPLSAMPHGGNVGVENSGASNGELEESCELPSAPPHHVIQSQAEQHVHEGSVNSRHISSLSESSIPAPCHGEVAVTPREGSGQGEPHTLSQAGTAVCSRTASVMSNQVAATASVVSHVSPNMHYQPSLSMSLENSNQSSRERASLSSLESYVSPNMHSNQPSLSLNEGSGHRQGLSRPSQRQRTGTHEFVPGTSRLRAKPSVAPNGYPPQCVLNFSAASARNPSQLQSEPNTTASVSTFEGQSESQLFSAPVQQASRRSRRIAEIGQNTPAAGFQANVEEAFSFSIERQRTGEENCVVQQRTRQSSSIQVLDKTQASVAAVGTSGVNNINHPMTGALTVSPSPDPHVTPGPGNRKYAMRKQDAMNQAGVQENFESINQAVTSFPAPPSAATPFPTNPTPYGQMGGPEGSGHNSLLSESGREVAQCSDTQSPALPGRSPLYPQLSPSPQESGSSEEEGHTHKRRKRRSAAKSRHGSVGGAQKRRKTEPASSGVLSSLVSFFGFAKKGPTIEQALSAAETEQRFSTTADVEEPEDDSFISCSED